MLFLRLSLLPSTATTRTDLHPRPGRPHPPLSSPVSLHFPPRRPTSPSPLLSAPRSSWGRPCSPAASDAVSDDFGEELRRLLLLLPPEMRLVVEAHPELGQLVEVVMDLGRRPFARFPSGDVFLSDRPISTRDLLHATSQVGDFGVDNRAGISRTLHRISAIRNRKGMIIGLTCRVGRAVTGSAILLRDLVKDGGSLLLIGPPGVGKTTIIREIARMLADDYKKRVMIVDTSNEIGGDGDIPHAGIGSARRLQVPNSEMQHKVLIEAVENHMPQVIVIDEIGTKLEAMAATTIAQRGIQLVATAHGVTIENLIMNPSLEMLVGGIQSVTLGDEEASRRGVQKTVLERKGPSTFTCAAEIISKTELRVHRNLESTVDSFLAGRSPKFEFRRMDQNGSTHEMLPIQKESFNDMEFCEEDEIVFEDQLVRDDEKIGNNMCNLEVAGKWDKSSHEVREGFHLFVYGITETCVLQSINDLEMDGMIGITNNISEADALLALHSKLKKNARIQAVAKSRDMPVFVTKTHSSVQITKAIRALIKEHASGFEDNKAEGKISSSEKADALEEARLAIEQVVIPRGECVRLLPRPSHIITAQIDLIERYKLKWETMGLHSDACLWILPLQAGIEEKNLRGPVAERSSASEDLEDYDDVTSLQNGVARLPLLPE